MRLVSGNFCAAAGKFYREVQSGLSEASRSSSSRRRKERESFKRELPQWSKLTLWQSCLECIAAKDRCSLPAPAGAARSSSW